MAQALRARRFSFVSSGVTALRDKDLGFHKGFLVRDPDGHVMTWTEEEGELS